MSHYIGMAGLHGCIPNYCASYDDPVAAANGLADVLGMSHGRSRLLMRDKYVELDARRDGNDYAEITECDCDDPAQHNDY